MALGKVAEAIGADAAKRLFNAWPDRGSRNQEIRINEADLALAMSICAQAGWNAAIAAVQQECGRPDREN
jgi:hypothetical protein